MKTETKTEKKKRNKTKTLHQMKFIAHTIIDGTGSKCSNETHKLVANESGSEATNIKKKFYHKICVEPEKKGKTKRNNAINFI